MTDVYTRRQLLERAAAGGALLSVPGLLAACGGTSKKTAGGTSSHKLAKTLHFSNWPAYIDKISDPVLSVNDLLTNPKLKGKITCLNSMGDALTLVMLENGDDPTNVTDAGFNKAFNRIKKAVDSKQIRQFTGNDYAPPLAKGDLAAAMSWSGDIAQLGNKHLHWNLPKTGGALWTDNMLIPKGGDIYTASVYMNYVYDPKVQGLMEAGDPKRNITGIYYIPPVDGAKQAALKLDPSVANNQLIFPSGETLSQVHLFD